MIKVKCGARVWHSIYSPLFRKTVGDFSWSYREWWCLVVGLFSTQRARETVQKDARIHCETTVLITYRDTSAILPIPFIHKEMQSNYNSWWVCVRKDRRLCVYMWDRVYVCVHFTQTCSDLQLISVRFHQSFYRLFKCHPLLWLTCKFVVGRGAKCEGRLSEPDKDIVSQL